jgi:hypothetical protein
MGIQDKGSRIKVQGSGFKVPAYRQTAEGSRLRLKA